MDAPTVLVGTTQSGKTYRSFRLFEAHPGPGIFWDVQWRGGEYSPGSTRVPDVRACVDVLARWDPGMEYPRIIIQDEGYNDLGTLVSYLWNVHRNSHVRGRPVPRLALFLDEVSLAADRYADNGNPAVRLFTQCYQHGVVGVAITQRPAQTSRNLLANAWEWYTFSPGRGDMDVYRDYGVLPPDPRWIQNPLDHAYYRFTQDGRVLQGRADGTEGEVSHATPEVPPVPPADAPHAVPPAGDAEGKADVGRSSGGQVRVL